MRPAAKAAAAGLGAAAAAWLFQRLEAYLDSDDCWLALADRLRRAQTPPSQSSFRVSCVLALGSRIRGEYVAGCNVEANNLGNSVLRPGGNETFGRSARRGGGDASRPHAATPLYGISTSPAAASPPQRNPQDRS